MDHCISLPIQGRNIFGLGVLLVAETVFCNTHKALENIFDGICLHRRQNKTVHSDLCVFG